jgi:hypothetical protein
VQYIALALNLPFFEELAHDLTVRMLDPVDIMKTDYPDAVATEVIKHVFRRKQYIVHCKRDAVVFSSLDHSEHALAHCHDFHQMSPCTRRRSHRQSTLEGLTEVFRASA